jgi:hypothetical protein
MEELMGLSALDGQRSALSARRRSELKALIADSRQLKAAQSEYSELWA